jgi:hypothetical protein
VLRLQAEEHVRDWLYQKALPNSDVAAGPAQVFAELLKHPFKDGQLAALRAAAPLCCRAWFAADVCLHSELYSWLLDPSRGRADLCKWRYGVVLTLARTAAEAYERQEASAAGGDDALDATLASKAEQLQSAVRAGPYGAPGGAADAPEAIPIVATEHL